MIVVTVGTQLAFDRLISGVDAWAARNPGVQLFAQIGPAASPPEHMQHEAFLSPSRAESLMRDASLIVAHAGMGSVLAALSLRKPIVILPRRGSLAEHRNDHQMATARWLEGRAGIFVAWDTSDLARLLDDRERLTTGEPICPHASGPLVERLSSVVAQALAEKRPAER